MTIEIDKERKRERDMTIEVDKERKRERERERHDY